MLRIGEVNFIYASTNYLHTLTGAPFAAAAWNRSARLRRCEPVHRCRGVPLEWAERIEALWGCRLQEGYGSTQCGGFGGSTCADGAIMPRGERGLMHLFEWETLFEMIDPPLSSRSAAARPASLSSRSVD